MVMLQSALSLKLAVIVHIVFHISIKYGVRWSNYYTVLLYNVEQLLFHPHSLD